MEGRSPIYQCPAHWTHATFLYPKSSPLFNDVKGAQH
jgi:hypothetical protein